MYAPAVCNRIRHASRSGRRVPPGRPGVGGGTMVRRSDPAIAVLEPDNVILVQLVTDLHLDYRLRKKRLIASRLASGISLRRACGGFAGARQRDPSGRWDGAWASASCRQQPGQADQVVGRGGEGELPADPRFAAMSRAVLQRHLFDPAEPLLDPLADALAHGIAGVSGRPTVDRRPAVGGVPGDMRRRSRYQTCTSP